MKGFKWVKRHREWSKKNKVPYQQLTQALFFVRYFQSIIITWAGECAPRLPCLPHVVLFGRRTHWQQIKLDHNVSFRPNHPSTSISLEFIVLVVWLSCPASCDFKCVFEWPTGTGPDDLRLWWIRSNQCFPIPWEDALSEHHRFPINVPHVLFSADSAVSSLWFYSIAKQSIP